MLRLASRSRRYSDIPKQKKRPALLTPPCVQPIRDMPFLYPRTSTKSFPAALVGRYVLSLLIYIVLRSKRLRLSDMDRPSELELFTQCARALSALACACMMIKPLASRPWFIIQALTFLSLFHTLFHLHSLFILESIRYCIPLFSPDRIP